MNQVVVVVVVVIITLRNNKKRKNLQVVAMEMRRVKVVDVGGMEARNGVCEWVRHLKLKQLDVMREQKKDGEWRTTCCAHEVERQQLECGSNPTFLLSPFPPANAVSQTCEQQPCLPLSFLFLDPVYLFDGYTDLQIISKLDRKEQQELKGQRV